MNTILALLAFFLGAMLYWLGTAIAAGVLPPVITVLQAMVAAVIAAILYIAAKLGQIPPMTVDVFIQFMAYGLAAHFAVSTVNVIKKRLAAKKLSQNKK